MKSIENIEVIAEIAQGFEGKHEQAFLLMKAAVSANANAAKYQLVYADELATKDYKYYKLFKSLEMSDATWISLAKNAKDFGIELNFDIFGYKSLQLAQKLKVKSIKLHATDLQNYGLLKMVAKSKIPRVLLGVGGGYLREIENALDILKNKKLVVFVGFQGYPTRTEDNQIDRVKYLYEKLSKKNKQIKIGFADHASTESQLSYNLAAMAIGAGANVIEKHITLGNVMKLEDYESALNPDQFAEFTNVVFNCSKALGKTVNNDDFGMSVSEMNYRDMIRRHVVANTILKKGTIIKAEQLSLKRTSSENYLTDINLLSNKKVRRTINSNSVVEIKDIE